MAARITFDRLLEQRRFEAQNFRVRLAEFQRFYSNYHSVRYTRDELAIRLHRAPDAKQLAQINSDFSDIKTSGEFRVTGPLDVERDEPALNDLPRLVFHFNRREHGRLRQLIDYLNTMMS